MTGTADWLYNGAHAVKLVNHSDPPRPAATAPVNGRGTN